MSVKFYILGDWVHSKKFFQNHNQIDVAEKFYEKVNKLVLIGSVYKRSDKQIQTVQKRYNDAVNGESITIDSIERWFSEDYLNTNPEIFDFF